MYPGSTQIIVDLKHWNKGTNANSLCAESVD